MAVGSHGMASLPDQTKINKNISTVENVTYDMLHSPDSIVLINQTTSHVSKW